jgi:hypothetical protein
MDTLKTINNTTTTTTTTTELAAERERAISQAKADKAKADKVATTTTETDMMTVAYTKCATLFVKADNALAQGSTFRFQAALFAVSSANIAKDMSFHADGNNGKGAWKGGKPTMAKIVAQNPNVKDSYTGDLSKGGKILAEFAPEILTMHDDDARFEAIVEFVDKCGKGLDAMYAEAQGPKPPSSATLPQMVANLLAWAAKNDIDGTAVLAEVMAQVGADADDDADVDA